MSKLIARIASHIMAAAEFVVALAVVGFFLWKSAGFRATIMGYGDRLTEVAVQHWPRLADVLAQQPVRWIMFSIVALVAIAIIGALFRLLARRYVFFVMTMRGLRLTVNVLTLLSSIWFAIYLHTILWGDFSILGQVIMPADDPKTVYFWDAITLAVNCGAYGLIQGAPFIFKPDTKVGWFVIDTVLSSFPIFVLGSGWFYYHLMPDWAEWWTTYRVGLMYVATLALAIDVIRIFTGAHLLLRGYVDSGTIAAVAH